MPNYRRATIYAPGDPGASGTLIQPIYLKELISRIRIKYGVTINTVSAMTAALADSISKIELVDGSTILFSLSGAEAVASNFYRTGKLPKEHLSLTVGDIAFFEVDIMFGRWVWDDTLAWDPTKFVAPQLRITWDSTTANAGVTVTTLAIYADIIDNPAKAPTGIILSKDQDQYAMAASTHEYIDLPVDYAIWNLGVRFKSSAYDPASLMSNFKISRDADAFIWLDQDAGQYIDGLNEMFPAKTENHVLDDAVTANTIYFRLVNDPDIKIAYDGTAFVTASTQFAVPTFTGNKLALAASVDIKKLTAILRGNLPHAVVPFFFGMLSDPTTWYKPQSTTRFRADLESGANAAAADTAYLFTEQLRPY